MEYTKTKHQVANIFTEALSCAKFDVFRVKPHNGTKGDSEKKWVLRGSVRNKKSSPTL